MDPLMEAYLDVYNEENKAEVYLNMSPEEKQKRRNIRWADNAHGITPDNTIMIRDKDTANLVNKMRVSRHKKSPSLEKERTRGTVSNKYLHRQQDKKELQNKLEKSFSVAENIEYILDVLVSEGFAVDYDGAESILEAMSDEWLGSLLSEAPFDIYRGSTTYDGVKVGEKEPVKVNRRPYKTLQGAKKAAADANEKYGAGIHSVRRTPEP
jgi:hypothetical protein